MNKCYSRRKRALEVMKGLSELKKHGMQGWQDRCRRTGAGKTVADIMGKGITGKSRTCKRQIQT
jgi:hypothetical protein